MKVGDLVRLRDDIQLPVEVYSSWNFAILTDEIGDIYHYQTAIVLDFCHRKNRIPGVKVAVGDLVGWTYETFMVPV